ncbi:MAG: SurA N-terminal domain-containing protein [Blastocatellia bacterium]|nr:SurA N-terminal domain-containing protein [Blastocatellia bacterium]MCS7157569.1 SurA N-terminal domain-containing protein [Blastocatellia bacterium]MCX7753521.1 SurA N-terminal domain-containing protein [Blastocatellia bacterium]MDW8166937.1 SurA N-terminal domain-containing protein [Acidobacteriota bacterium]MDW8257514.1 SurA N-terminal domain-containing protein [Acidobacteriota bacterium]
MNALRQSDANSESRATRWSARHFHGHVFLARFLRGALLGLLVFPFPTSAQTILVDRIAAVVNGMVITESDILWYLALDPEIPEGTFSEDLKARALQQLIDQALLHQEAEKLPTLTIAESEIEDYLAQLRARFPSEGAFRRRLAAVGLDERTLREIARRRMEILRFIDFRFRSFVFVSEQEVQGYYEGHVVSEAQRRGTTPPSLEQVRSLIERILREEKTKAEMIAWLDDARRTAEIVLYPPYRSLLK